MLYIQVDCFVQSNMIIKKIGLNLDRLGSVYVRCTQLVEILSTALKKNFNSSR